MFTLEIDFINEFIGLFIFLFTSPVNFYLFDTTSGYENFGVVSSYEVISTTLFSPTAEFLTEDLIFEASLAGAIVFGGVLILDNSFSSLFLTPSYFTGVILDEDRC